MVFKNEIIYNSDESHIYKTFEGTNEANEISQLIDALKE